MTNRYVSWLAAALMGGALACTQSPSGPGNGGTGGTIGTDRTGGRGGRGGSGGSGSGGSGTAGTAGSSTGGSAGGSSGASGGTSGTGGSAGNTTDAASSETPVSEAGASEAGGGETGAAASLIESPLGTPPQNLKDVGLFPAFPDMTQVHPRAVGFKPQSRTVEQWSRQGPLRDLARRPENQLEHARRLGFPDRHPVLQDLLPGSRGGRQAAAGGNAAHPPEGHRRACPTNSGSSSSGSGTPMAPAPPWRRSATESR